MNGFCAQDGVFIDVAPGIEVKEPIHLVFVVTGDAPVVSQPRCYFRVGEGASFSLGTSSVCNGSGHFSNAYFQWDVQDNAKVNFVGVNLEEREGFRFETTRVRQGTSSDFNAVYITKGSQLTRLDIQVDMAGESANCSLNGLNLLGHSSELYSRTRLNHLVPKCTSSQSFKSVLSDKAVTEYQGLVYVDQIAQLTDASQSNPNLILSDQARALSRPQLEIFADDVVCGHGATVGQLDDQHVFYLQSRGFSESEAKWVLLQGFADEIVDMVQVPFIQKASQKIVKETLPELVDSL